MTNKRSETERRLRQSERLSRLLRVLNCISSSGKWDADSLAKELECSRRTIQRLLQTLSLAGVPWYFDDRAKAYRLRPGFRLSILSKTATVPKSDDRATEVQAILRQAEEVVARLRRLCDQLEN